MWDDDVDCAQAGQAIGAIDAIVPAATREHRPRHRPRHRPGLCAHSALPCCPAALRPASWLAV
jgi:hypothetical protein